jgi:hypothetical protein
MRWRCSGCWAQPKFYECSSFTTSRVTKNYYHRSQKNLFIENLELSQAPVPEFHYQTLELYQHNTSVRTSGPTRQRRDCKQVRVRGDGTIIFCPKICNLKICKRTCDCVLYRKSQNFWAPRICWLSSEIERFPSLRYGSGTSSQLPVHLLTTLDHGCIQVPRGYNPQSPIAFFMVCCGC